MHHAEFAKSVKIDDCRIINRPDLVFLCGGKTCSPSTAYLSARDYFWHHIKAEDESLHKRLRLAENINDWFDRAMFGDLLEVEECLADLAELIILFVESPGSIAELGAFAVSEILRSKTLAIINQFHGTERSFIADGPIRRISNNREDLVMYFNWDPEDVNGSATLSTFCELSKEVSDFLNVRRANANKEERLDRRARSHCMLLVSDIINIFGLALISELEECLSAWRFDIDRKQLQQYIFILQKVGLITRVRYSSQTYYASRTEKAGVRYDYTADAVFRDRERIKHSIRNTFSGSKAAAFKNHLARQRS